MDQTLYESLIRAAYRFLSYRPRSEREIKEFLTKKLSRWKIAGSASVNKVMDRLRELGYVDDRKFVEWWIGQRSAFRPKGIRVLTAELARKGIDRKLIQTVVSRQSNEGEFDEYALAKKSILKKSIIWGNLPLIEQKKKSYTFLAQRGFSSDIIGRIIDEIGKKD